MYWYIKFLVSLATKLDLEGKFKEADKIDEEFAEFLKKLENGELEFNNTYSGGVRDPRLPYSQFGRGTLPIYAIPGPQADD